MQLESVRSQKTDPTLQVTQEAQLPTSSTGLPRWLLVFLAAVVGFAIGSVGAVALSYFSPKVGDATEVAALLPVPVLATIPRVSFIQRRKGLSPTAMPPFVFEQIRKVRAQIPGKNDASVIMVTSTDSGDGKTTVAAGLASAFAEGKEEVILLDLDLRRPGVADIFGIEPTSGRSLQLEAAALAHLLVPVPGLPHVKVLSARRASISVLERLVSELPELLREARGLAKWVVLDTPPLGEVGDGLRFAPGLRRRRARRPRAAYGPRAPDPRLQPADAHRRTSARHRRQRSAARRDARQVLARVPRRRVGDRRGSRPTRPLGCPDRQPRERPGVR